MDINETTKPVKQKFAIELLNLELTLTNGAIQSEILRGINLEVGRGEAIGIIGPSGSGKTSLLMVLAGLEKLTTGTVKINGTNLSRLDEDALAQFRRDQIGFVFQSFHLIPTMTAIENTALPLEFAGIEGAFDAAQKQLELVGLGHRLRHYPGQLSGGEQQRVALARAFVTEPEILLADEPTGSLDLATGEAVIDVLFELKDRLGTTLLLVTHAADLAARCNRILHMADGQIASDELRHGR
ncbi:MAG: ABC transporter [Rhodospirillaceae bacterium TMED8]|nr:ABC transporter [Magnetovibrio sp.]OUT51338.1 MAG: ABC transporter [Rhodospirillaceae bacterium TMED8]|tara:strand:+ start:4731 stop:5453 length:723 start_codon:yes stop_codon:yes gene_type:complete